MIGAVTAECCASGTSLIIMHSLNPSAPPALVLNDKAPEMPADPAPTQHNAEREAFEKWAISEGWEIDKIPRSEMYLNETTRYAEKAWQACSLSHEAKLKELQKKLENVKKAAE